MSSLRILVCAPTRPGSTSGNATTSQRWARRLSELGHDVCETSHGDPCESADLVVVIHAKRGAGAVRRYASEQPRPKIVVAFGGTDVYGDLDDPDIVSSLELSDAFVVLQPLARDRLPAQVHDRTWVIFQSVEDAPEPTAATSDTCDVVVLSHLREVKDPLRAAEAACLLSADSQVRVLHAGAAHDEAWATRAEGLMAACDKYEWLGEMSRGEALALLNRSSALVLTSLSEGGANVVSEALALGKPVLASRIDGTVGMLGADYPGYYEVGDTEGLARLLERFAADSEFANVLIQHCAALSSLVDPATERDQWRDLISSI